MLIDRSANLLVSKGSNSNKLFCGMQNRIEIPKVLRATPAPF